MTRPDRPLIFERARAGGVVLLDLQIADVMTSSAKGGQQLRFVVLKSLPPLGMACTDGENLALKMQWAAVGCELFPCDGGPVLPQTGESSTNPPLLAEFVQTVAQRGRGRWRSLLQHLKTLEAPALRFRSDCHGLRLKGRPAEISLLSSRVHASTMGFFDRLSRLVRANANAAVSSMEDPSKILDQSVADMQADLVKLRQAVALAIASQKRLKNQAEQAESQSKTWYERAELALKKGEESLAREALTRRKTFQDTATSLNSQVQSQDGQVETLKKSLVALEGKIAQAKTKKDMLKARAEAAKAQQQLQSAVGNIGTDSAMAAFERMEDKVEALEATGQAAAELAGADLETQFASLEGGSDVDDELDALRLQLKGGPEAVALPASSETNEVKTVKVEEVDADLENLKRSIDKL